MATVVQKSRVSTESKDDTRISTEVKSYTQAVTRGTSGASTVSNASQLSFAQVSTLAQSTVQAALEELSYRHFQGTSSPNVGVTSGDLWSDTSSNRLKYYDGSSWSLISGAANNLSDDYFRFTSAATVSSGNLAEFRNNSNSSSFAIRHDGVVLLKDQSSAPTAVANGLYSDGADLYHGTE
tara:strand:- start:1801 stop:2343 length:543 start_codon:yes stop_codon:yes gene_type:complete